MVAAVVSAGVSRVGLFHPWRCVSCRVVFKCPALWREHFPERYSSSLGLCRKTVVSTYGSLVRCVVRLGHSHPCKHCLRTVVYNVLAGLFDRRGGLYAISIAACLLGDARHGCARLPATLAGVKPGRRRWTVDFVC